MAYTLLIIPFGIRVIREKGKRSIADMIVLLIPYLIIGAALAWYNYVRFDSILEFGQSYQLTAQDQVHSEHTWQEIPLLLWLGLIQPPSFSAIFPFVIPADLSNNYAGQFYMGPNVVSLFGQAPMLAAILFPVVWKQWKMSRFSKNVLRFTAALGIALLTAEMLNAGVEWRYTSEIAPILSVAALLLVSNAVKQLATDGAKTTMMTAMYGLALYALAVAFLRGVDGMQGFMLRFHPEFYYSIERLFCFWK